VGIVHRVIAGRAPGIPVIDLTHQIPTYDVRAGALTLWRAAAWLVPGVILAVVDPGVGTARRAVAVEISRVGAVLVGPDNGLLLRAATSLGPITGAVALPPPTTAGLGLTFAGRDVFAPAAAEIAKGVELRRLGPAIDPQSLAGDPIPIPQPEPDGRLRAEVLWVDRFGNAQLNTRPADLASQVPIVEVTTGPGHTWPSRLVTTYAELEPDEVGLVADSYGFLSVSCNQSPAAARTGLRAGDAVWLGSVGQG
jgi:S-adenosylmethionine hydrolase